MPGSLASLLRRNTWWSAIYHRSIAFILHLYPVASKLPSERVSSISKRFESNNLYFRFTINFAPPPFYFIINKNSISKIFIKKKFYFLNSRKSYFFFFHFLSFTIFTRGYSIMDNPICIVHHHLPHVERKVISSIVFTLLYEIDVRLLVSSQHFSISIYVCTRDRNSVRSLSTMTVYKILLSRSNESNPLHDAHVPARLAPLALLV